MSEDQQEQRPQTKITEESNDTNVSLVAKWGKKKIALTNLNPATTILELKEMLTESTNILPKRQKLIGLVIQSGEKAQDCSQIQELKFKKMKSSQEFILMGTPEKEIFVDPSDKEELPDVVDDFDLDFTAGSEEWVEHLATGENLRNFTESTIVHVMNEPREGKPLLVVDLDHCLLDFSSRRLQNSNSLTSTSIVSSMKRPHMDLFLSNVYQYYDLVVWSQTSWRWLETKLTELGMLTHPGYKFCFVLDKTSMFAVTSTKRDGTSFRHHVKPLQIIWSKFPRWGVHNTAHIDDLRRNFALNLKSGVKVSGYYRKKSSARRDSELMGLSRFLEMLARECKDFQEVDFREWTNIVSGKVQLKNSKKN